MNSLLRSCALALPLLLAGCGSSAGGSKATLTANWSVKRPDGTADVCPTNYNKVKIVAQGYTKYAGIQTGDPFVQIYDCQAGTGAISLQTSGDEPSPCDETGQCTRSQARDLSGVYEVSVIITESTGQLAYVSTQTQKVDLSGGAKALSFTFYPHGGFRDVEWNLEAKSTGSFVSCAAGSVDTIKLHSTRTADADYMPVTGGRETIDTFPCTGMPGVPIGGTYNVGAGITSPLEPGYYSMRMEAFSGSTLVGVSEEQTDRHIEDRGSINVVYESYYLVLTNR